MMYRSVCRLGAGRKSVSCVAVCFLALGVFGLPPQPSFAQSPDRPGSESSEQQRAREPEKSEPRMTPLQRLMKDGVPDNAIARARLRENLYALLATAPDKKAAKAIGGALEQVWMSSGSETVDLLMKRALRADNAKKRDVALKILDALIEQAPDYAEAWNRRAYLHYKGRDYRAAAGDLRRTLALDPKHYRALGGLGTILRESGDDSGAFEVYEKLMDINPLAPGAQKAYEELKGKVKGQGI